MNFYNINPQSDNLQGTNTHQPSPLTDLECLDHNIIHQRSLEVDEYFNMVKYQRLNENATERDLKEAERIKTLLTIAESVPSIQRNLAPVGAQAVADIIMLQINANINAQFGNINAQFANINAQFVNINGQLAQLNEQFAYMHAQNSAQFANIAAHLVNINVERDEDVFTS